MRLPKCIATKIPYYKYTVWRRNFGKSMAFAPMRHEVAPQNVKIFTETVWIDFALRCFPHGLGRKVNVYRALPQSIKPESVMTCTSMSSEPILSLSNFGIYIRFKQNLTIVKRRWGRYYAWKRIRRCPKARLIIRSAERRRIIAKTAKYRTKLTEMQPSNAQCWHARYYGNV